MILYDDDCMNNELFNGLKGQRKDFLVPTGIFGFSDPAAFVTARSKIFQVLAIELGFRVLIRSLTPSLAMTRTGKMTVDIE